MNDDILDHGLSSWRYQHQEVPDYLILDISDAIISLTNYIGKDFGNKYLAINEFVDSILQAVCTSAPEEGLEDLLSLIHDTLTEEGFEPYDVHDIMTETETLGSFIIKEFQMLGFYDLKDFWGYHVVFWLTPSIPVLGYGLDLEIESIYQKINVYHKGGSVTFNL